MKLDTKNIDNVIANLKQEILQSNEKNMAIEKIIESLIKIKNEYENPSEVGVGGIVMPKIANKWISIKDKLPDVGEKVLVAIGGGWVILIGRLMNDGWTAFYTDGECLVGESHDPSKVTHWMPLPETPES